MKTTTDYLQQFRRAKRITNDLKPITVQHHGIALLVAQTGQPVTNKAMLKHLYNVACEQGKKQFDEELFNVKMAENIMNFFSAPADNYLMYAYAMMAGTTTKETCTMQDAGDELLERFTNFVKPLVVASLMNIEIV